MTMNRLLKIVTFLLLFPVTVMASTKDKKVLICGICKNVASSMQNTISGIESLGSHFKDYRVIIYENNSTDSTKKLLKQWRFKNNKVHIICENLSDEQLTTFKAIAKEKNCFPRKIIDITHARNKVLKIAYQEKYKDYDYLIVADLDFIFPWDISGILSSFKYKQPWDVITANGITQSGQYFDLLALRSKKWPIGRELDNEKFIPLTNPRPFKYGGNELIEVMSAFGGFAIYKFSTIRGIFYGFEVDDNLKAYYFNLLKNKDTIKNPYLKPFVKQNKNGKFFYKNNPNLLSSLSCCEHVNLHFKLIKQRNARIFINPKMYFKYKKK